MTYVREPCPADSFVILPVPKQVKIGLEFESFGCVANSSFWKYGKYRIYIVRNVFSLADSIYRVRGMGVEYKCVTTKSFHELLGKLEHDDS